MSIAVAFRAFFAALFNHQKAQAIEAALACQETPAGLPAPQPTPQPVPSPAAAAEKTQPPQPAAPSRSDAITLLAMLQREARFVDLVQEPLDQYSDDQVGAAARPCLSACRSALARVFDLGPLLAEAEGETVPVPADASPLRYQWADGTTAGRSSATLVHPGWQAGRCEIAHWTGSDADANVIAPAQIEAS